MNVRICAHIVLVGWLFVLTHYVPARESPQFVTDTTLTFQTRGACEDARAYFTRTAPPSTVVRPYDASPCLPTRTEPGRTYTSLNQ